MGPALQSSRRPSALFTAELWTSWLVYGFGSNRQDAQKKGRMMEGLDRALSQGLPGLDQEFGPRLL